MRCEPLPYREIANVVPRRSSTDLYFESAPTEIAQQRGLFTYVPRILSRSEDDEEDLDEAVDNHTFFRGDNANRVRPEAKDVQGRREKVNESVEKTTEEASNTVTDRFQKLANIQK